MLEASRGPLGDFLGRFGSGGERLRFPPVGVTPAVTVAAAVAGVVGIVVVAGAPEDDAASSVAATGAGATMVAGLVVLLFLVPAGLRLPGVVHLAYLGGTMSVPLVGLALWARGDIAIATLFLVPAPVGLYATHVEPHRLRTDRATVDLPASRTGQDPIRIAVLADLQTNHIGDDEHRAVDWILSEVPDLILIAGDLFQGSEHSFIAEVPALQALLGRLDAPGGVFCVRGDVDPGDRADRSVAGTGIRLLDDHEVELDLGDRRIRLGGNRLEYARPDAVLDLEPNSRVDLTVAGHTHGGQIVVPGFGPPVTYTRVPRHVAAGGLHQVQGNRIYVSTGVGRERMQAPQIRLFCRPSIGILTLQSRGVMKPSSESSAPTTDVPG